MRSEIIMGNKLEQRLFDLTVGIETARKNYQTAGNGLRGQLWWRALYLMQRERDQLRRLLNAGA